MKKINEEANETVYALDIYGQIDKNYAEEFEKIKNTLPSYIKYVGCVDSEKTVKTLENYYLLLFPTKFRTCLLYTSIAFCMLGVSFISALFFTSNS